jgi:hypothetical protein
MQRFAERYQTPEFRSAHPTYAAHPIEGDPSAVERRARHEIHLGDLRFAALADALGGDRLECFQAWETYLRALDQAGDPLPEAERTRLAANRCAAWRTLHETFRTRGSHEEYARDIFEARFDEMTRLLANLAPPMPTIGPD